ncbi:hypothetical protein AGMMS50239_41120 [Bacteroidia bacterium]|nr:hypothetical protein AGMMS50239_41120 [Bacteroidia bacterium]
MLNRVQLLKINKIFFVGDVHGKIEDVIHKLCMVYEERESLIIFCGDVGVGFSSFPPLTKMNKLLKKSNNYAILYRGNHSDPAAYNDPVKSKPYRKSNIFTIPDYTLINASGEYKEANILCIGGGISIDRTGRMKGKTYWENEDVYIDGKALEEITIMEEKVDIVATHDAPDFCYPLTKSLPTSQWHLNDTTLEQDIITSRAKLTFIYNDLSAGGKKPAEWYYGHHHMSKYENLLGTTFYLLDCSEIKPVQWYNYVNI